MGKKQVCWVENGKAKMFVSPSVSHVKRVRDAAKSRGIKEISRIMPLDAPVPFNVQAEIQRMRKWRAR